MFVCVATGLLLLKLSLTTNHVSHKRRLDVSIMFYPNGNPKYLCQSFDTRKSSEVKYHQQRCTLTLIKDDTESVLFAVRTLSSSLSSGICSISTPCEVNMKECPKKVIIETKLYCNST